MNPPDFLITPYALIADDNLSPTDCRVYSVVYWLTKLKNEKCTASNRTLAEVSKKSVSSVRESLTRLEERGYIRRILGSGKGADREEIIPLITMGRQTPLPRNNQGDDEISSGGDDEISSQKKNNVKKSSKEDTLGHTAHGGVAGESGVSDNTPSLNGTGPSQEFRPAPAPGTAQVIDAFRTSGLSPALAFNNRTQRTACADLLKIKPLPEILSLIEYCSSISGKPYAPSIHNPTDLRDKLGKIEAYKKRNNPEKVYDPRLYDDE